MIVIQLRAPTLYAVCHVCDIQPHKKSIVNPLNSLKGKRSKP